MLLYWCKYITNGFILCLLFLKRYIEFLNLNRLIFSLVILCYFFLACKMHG